MMYIGLLNYNSNMLHDCDKSLIAAIKYKKDNKTQKKLNSVWSCVTLKFNFI